MNTAHYELRTVRGTPVIAFDNERRALAERDRRSLAIGCKLTVWRVERVEARVG